MWADSPSPRSGFTIARQATNAYVCHAAALCLSVALVAVAFPIPHHESSFGDRLNALSFMLRDLTPPWQQQRRDL